MASSRARIAVALLAAAFIAIACQRLHTIDQVPNRDVLLYSVIGHELLAGRLLYSDLWDHKPPLIYGSYAAAEKLVGYGRQQLYLLAVVLSMEGIEHFENQTGFVRECARVLRPGGLLILSTPNVLTMSARASQFFTGSRILKHGPINEVSTLRGRHGRRVAVPRQW